MMDVRTEIIAKETTVLFQTRTKLKNFDSELPYVGKSTQKGMSEEDIITELTFPGGDKMQTFGTVSITLYLYYFCENILKIMCET